jgi:hypothetical protein
MVARKHPFVLAVLVLGLLMTPLVGWSQPGPPIDPDVPISGIEFLLGGGALMGIRHLLSRYKSTRKE